MNETASLRQLAQSKRDGSASIIAHAHILPREQLILTARRAKQGDERSKTALIHSTSRLVYNVAAHQWRMWSPMLPHSAQFDDVFSAGLEGIMYALKKYDPDSGNAFTTYCKLWIQTRCQRTIYNMLGSTQIPESAVRKGIHPESMLLAKNNLSIERGLHEDGDDLLERRFQKHHHDDHGLGVHDIYALVSGDPQLVAITELLEQGYNDPEIAACQGITRQRVQQLRAKIGDLLVDKQLA